MAKKKKPVATRPRKATGDELATALLQVELSDLIGLKIPNGMKIVEVDGKPFFQCLLELDLGLNVDGIRPETDEFKKLANQFIV